MSITAFELFLTAAGALAGGLAISVIQGRRHRREQTRREREMAHALAQRRDVYDALENHVFKLIARFDRMEGEFKLKLAAAEQPGILAQDTVVLRSRNPELWDLERENSRVQARLLGELAKSRSRAVELMQQLQALEPEAQRSADELGRLRKQTERASANARELEAAAAAKSERLEKRARELEAALSRTSTALAGAQKELAGLRGSNDAHVEAAWAALCDLRPMLEELERSASAANPS